MNDMLTSSEVSELIDVLRVEAIRERREREIQRTNRISQLMVSEFRFTIYYHPNQKNVLGVYDAFIIEGLETAQRVLNYKLQYNLGISDIRITVNGEVIKKLRFNGNEIKSLNFGQINLIS
jgi:hypothetical protein